MRTIPLLLMVLLAASAARAQSAPPTTRPVPPKPASHLVKQIEGWSVHVDYRLLRGADLELGERALGMLGAHLKKIAATVPADKVERLRRVHIWLDRTHGGLRTGQYHPSRGWLKKNGYDEALAKCVHLPDAADFASERMQREQPWMILHELAHAYHDQVLNFEEPRIKETWKKFVASGKYDLVKHVNGRMVRHYGLTDQKEFFAEMSEAYFGMNDFFPFNREELQKAEPEIFELMEEIWGKLE